MTIFHAGYETALCSVSQELLAPEHPAASGLPLDPALRGQLLQATRNWAASTLCNQARHARLMEGIGETDPDRLASAFASTLVSEGPYGDYPTLSRFLHMLRIAGAEAAPRAMSLLFEGYLVVQLAQLLPPAEPAGTA